MEEGNKLLNIGVGLLLFVIVVAAIFTVVNVAQKSKDESMDKLTNVMGNMDQTQYNQFDQKIVSGSIVAASLENFKSQSVSIVVRTANGYCVRYLGGITQTLGGTAIPKVQTNHNNTAVDGTGFAINNGKSPTAGTFLGYLASDWDDPTVYNQDFSGVTKPAEPQYIKPTGRFTAILIKDGNENVIGVSFSQRPER